MREIEETISKYLKGRISYNWQLSEDRSKYYDLLEIHQNTFGNENIYTIILDIENYNLDRIKEEIKKDLLFNYINE